MKKYNVCFMMASILCALGLAGCQRAPDGVEGNGIMHAKSDMEQQVQDIAAAGPKEQTQAQAGAQPQGAYYQGTVGTGDNKINIKAEIPALPDKLHILTLKPDEGLDRDALLAFLDSKGGSIEDTSQELLKEIEENDRENSTMNESGEKCLYSKFGDHSAIRLEDGTKTASFTYHTGAYYMDQALMEKCMGIYDGDFSETPVAEDQMDEGSFSANMAAEILLDKVEAAGVRDLAMKKIYYHEGSDYSCYYMEFVPVYDGLAVDIGANSYELGQVLPNGFASVSKEGVAEVQLIDFCGRAAEQELVVALSFEQVLKILEQYLDSGMIQSDGKITYDRVELNYYPVPSAAPARDEIEYKPELVLTPIWHIYIPLDVYVDEGYSATGSPSNICINAVTGELVY